MLDHNALIEQLHTIGFTNYEARCLIAVIEDHPATAYDIAKRAGVPRANAYSALDSLVRKEAVQPVSENPIRFAPIDPDVMLRRIADATTDRCLSLAHELSAVKKPAESEYVWSIPETEQVHAKIEEMIDSADNHVWIKGNRRVLERHHAALVRAAGRGIDIVIILFGEEKDVERYRVSRSATVYLHEGSGTPVGQSDHLFCLAIDYEEGLTASIREGGYGIYTQNRPVVELIGNMIRHEVYLAEIFREFGPQIEARFGDMLIRLRERLLPAEYVAALKKRLSAKKRRAK